MTKALRHLLCLAFFAGALGGCDYRAAPDYYGYVREPSYPAYGGYLAYPVNRGYPGYSFYYAPPVVPGPYGSGWRGPR
jgi:hypothetical protein